MTLAIKITPPRERLEGVNRRLLAAQCVVGGCVVYGADDTLQWTPDDPAPDLDVVTDALEELLALEVLDPTLDDFAILSGNEAAKFALDGFTLGLRNGLAFRQTSVEALKHALTEAEGRLVTLANEVQMLKQRLAIASDPDLIHGALLNVHDMDVTLESYAAAVSEAIKGAVQ